ncbi:MAG: thiosulfate oxidation carrier protein SoxY [Halothiobacillaceae bacterium]|jgi:sulfur-oxidizing protein SoxY|nr:thiosulfate oxidation carrier protein SoxY [Halothiobacillaceae bacterium]MDY0049840.1 thiosulfate oxidation carrier protein SoxY [Halothiobacillaceae bacterium]
MQAKRRVFLKGSLAASAVGVAVGAGLLTPRTVLAAWPEAAYKAKDAAGALKGALGVDSATDSADVTVKAPDIAENGAVVPITIESKMAGAEMIAMLVDGNEMPLVCDFTMTGAQAYISTRIRMGKTSNVVGVVKAGGKLYQAKKEVKVTIGGCGG